MDGSHHNWFEGRGDEIVLMGCIDDAANKIFGRFYKYEGTIPAMDCLRRYINRILEPVNAKEVIVEERINGEMIITRNNRALGFKEIHSRPFKENPKKPFKIRKKYIPPKDHPWRRYPVLPKQDISKLA